MNPAAYTTQQNYGLAAAQSDPERPEGHFTSRVRSLADQAEQFARRLERLLMNVRGAPPPAPAGLDGISIRASSMGDHLNHHESACKNIDALLNELEGLL